MKISLEWLAQYLPAPSGPIDASAAADALTAGGLNVESITPLGDDTILDVEVTSNRGDCLCHIGVARELAALLKREFREVTPVISESPTAAASVAAVQIDALDLCPHYTARILRGVKVRPSPPWMARRLEAVGLRPINNIVDITNYVMFEMGQPLHTFNLERLEGARIIVRRARKDEKLLSLDGKERTLTPEMLVIADANRAVALAGVMGGKDSEIGFETSQVFLESARFDPLCVRRTTRALGMEKTDSSYRFERGIDPTLPDRASRRAAQLILEIAGGELLAGCLEAGSAAVPTKTVKLRWSKLRQVLGIDVGQSEAVDVLRRLQFQPQKTGDGLEVTVPSWRADVSIEADLVEEIARSIGYDRIPTRQEISIHLASVEPAARARERIRETLVGAGYFESVTVSFVSDLLAGDFVPPQSAGLPRADPTVRKDNARLRPSLLPGLLESVQRNENVGNPSPRLFETGSVFWNDKTGGIVESRRLGIVGGGDVREVRGVVEDLLARLDADKSIAVTPEACPGFAAGGCGRVEWAGKPIGYLGKISRSIAEKLSLHQPPAAELDLSALIAGLQLVGQLKSLPKYPAMRRDLSLVVSETTPYEKLERLIHTLELSNLESLQYVTTYRGKPLEKGTKSVTVELAFRSEEGTLTSQQVDELVQRVAAAAKEQLAASLRV